MAHYRMQPTWNNTGVAHENGDVEQSHRQFKRAVDQALRVRGSRDFLSRAAYEQFLQNLIHKRNQTRTTRFVSEKAALRPLPASMLAPCKELHVVVSRFSTITVATNATCGALSPDRDNCSREGACRAPGGLYGDHQGVSASTRSVANNSTLSPIST
jgi:ribosomal protein S21